MLAIVICKNDLQKKSFKEVICKWLLLRSISILRSQDSVTEGTIPALTNTLLLTTSLFSLGLYSQVPEFR